jgi:SAM-dependent methyltransferase
LYIESAALYDAIYASKFDFSAGALRVRELIDKHKQSAGSSLLDVACGTGAHLVQLCDYFSVEGLDLSPEMVAIARTKLPQVPIHVANMVDFNLGRRFDVILCLGSSIGYVKSVARLRQTLSTFAQHLELGGIVVIEPWFTPEVWEDGRVTVDLVDEPDLKVARMLVSGLSGCVSTLEIHHLVALGRNVENFVEHHELGLFSIDDSLAAFRNAGLMVSYDSTGLSGRGLYIGTLAL